MTIFTPPIDPNDANVGRANRTPASGLALVAAHHTVMERFRA